jgi:uncharacterized phage protein gp47/JayE
MTFVDGRYIGSEPEDILNVMIEVANNRRDENLSESEVSVVNEVYEPFSMVAAQLQVDMGEVLDSTRVRYAEGFSLDLIGEQIGITRESATAATGIQKFYFPDGITREDDVNIPKGFGVQTPGTDPISYETQESTTLKAGNSSTKAPIIAIQKGTESNVGPGSITEFGTTRPDPDMETTNPKSVVGGTDKEIDDNYRERIRDYNSEEAQATHPAIIRKLESLDKTVAVTVFVNDTDTDGAEHNLDAGNIEVVIDYDGDMKDVAEALMGIKAAGEPVVGGVNGTLVEETVELPNGQEVIVPLSEPTGVNIYVDVELTYNPDDYPGDAAVKNSIVDYIGGYYYDGSIQKNGLEVGQDVLFGEVEYSVREIPGVYDVTLLEVDDIDPPTNTSSNIPIANNELSTTDAREGSSNISVTSSEWNM